jgi:hypothetical protein
MLLQKLRAEMCFVSTPSIDIIQLFVEKAQNAEKLKKPLSGENGCCGCCGNATVRSFGLNSC